MQCLVVLFLADQFGKAQILEHSFGLLVDSGILSLEFGFLGDELHLSLSLLFLELERDTSDGAGLNSSHESGGVPGDLVSDSLGGDHGNVVQNSLVVMEVNGHPIYLLG